MVAIDVVSKCAWVYFRYPLPIFAHFPPKEKEKNEIPAMAEIIDIFLFPLAPFESKKNGGECRYSERQIYAILATIVTIFGVLFLIQKGEWG